MSQATLLTAPGTSAIAVVRLAGPLAGGFLQDFFSKPPKPGRCVHGVLKDESGETIDDPIVVQVASQTFDLNLHGGRWVVQATLDLARRTGFEVLETLSIPLREGAVDGSDAIQRDVLRSLPNARTELAVRALLAQIDAWRDLTEKAHGLQSVGVPIDAHENAHPQVVDPSDRSLYWLLNLPRVAIVGPANVGKSTLANRLFETDRSITADLPGTTRDWVGEVANLDGLAVMLIDTPGLRETIDPIEAEAISRAKTPIDQADLVVLVLDVTRPLEGEQADLVHQFPDALVVLNKSDQPKQFELPGLETVATTGAGIDELRRAIRAHFGIVEPYDLSKQRSWTVEEKYEPQMNADGRR